MPMPLTTRTRNLIPPFFNALSADLTFGPPQGHLLLAQLGTR